MKGSAKNACTLPRTMHSSASLEGNCTGERGREREREREGPENVLGFRKRCCCERKERKGKREGSLEKEEENVQKRIPMKTNLMDWDD